MEISCTCIEIQSAAGTLNWVQKINPLKMYVEYGDLAARFGVRACEVYNAA